ncbi:probable metalloreductase Aim14p [Diutina catenulata]
MDARHGGHGDDSSHYANVKYGWITLAASALYLAVSLVYHSAYLRAKVPPVSLAVTVAVLAGAALVLLVVEPHAYSSHVSTLLKRAARVAFAGAPLSGALAVRPPRVPYLRRVRVHRWVGWVCTGLTTFHGVGFLVRWYARDELGTKLAKFDNLVGFFMLLGQWVLVAVSVADVARYSVFYWIHNTVVVLYLGGALVHARPGVVLLAALAAGVCALQYASHWVAHPVNQVSVLAHPQSRLVVAKLPMAPLFAERGAHIRLSSHRYLPSHPYSVAGVGDDGLELVLNRRRFDVTHATKLTGPYPPEVPRYAPDTPVVVCCGGSGISMAAPLAMAYPNARVVWCVRSSHDVHVLTHLSEVPDPSRLEVYVTRGEPVDEPGDEPGDEGTDAGEALMMHSVGDTVPYVDPKRLHRGRPKWDKVIAGCIGGAGAGTPPPAGVANTGDPSDATGSKGLDGGSPGSGEVSGAGNDSRLGSGSGSDTPVSSDASVASIAGSGAVLSGGASGPVPVVIACGPPSLVASVEHWSKVLGATFAQEPYAM